MESTFGTAVSEELMINDCISFMQSLSSYYGDEKGEEMWDTIITTLDPSMKRKLLMKMMKGDFGTSITIRGFQGEPRKVMAIKAVRNITGLGLKEAKAIIDQVFGPENSGGTPVTIKVDSGQRRDAIRQLEEVGCII